MADTQTVEQQAALMGWVPKEQFRGDEANWVEAEAFVEKGKHVMPILHKNNERLLATVGGLNAELASLKAKIAEQSASMEDFRVFHEEATKAQVAAARREILDGLKAAKVDGDVDAEVAAQAQLSEFDSAQRVTKTVATVVPPKEAPVSDTISPEFKAWNAVNTWFGTDHIKTGMAQGVANKLRAEGNTKTGNAFLDDVTAGVDALFGGGSPRQDKVEGGGGAGGPRGSGPATYANLPAEARAICDKQAARFVGENKMFKDVKSWQTHYAKLYTGE
jgi:hypothetical protein